MSDIGGDLSRSLFLRDRITPVGNHKVPLGDGFYSLYILIYDDFDISTT